MEKRRGFGTIGIMAALTAAAGLWHLQDVRTGAAATGDGWLVGVYLLLWVLVLAAVIAFGWLFLRKIRGRSLDLAAIYPAVGLVLGLLYLFVLPPMSAPDEISHYITAYELSSRLLGQPAQAENGRILVRLQDRFLEDVYGDYEPDGEISGAAGREDSVVLGSELNESTYRAIYNAEAAGLDTPQEQQARAEGLPDTAMAESPQYTVNTTPAAYLPQALGIALARLLRLDSIWLAYLGRLMNLLFFVTMTWLSMKRLPFGKEVLFGVALLPMSLHLSASFSYDVMILACMFLFSAVCFDLAYARSHVRVRDVALLAALMAAAGPCKMIYAPMMGLCLLIPVKKFGGRWRWLASAAVVGGAWAAAMVLVNADVVSSYAAVEEAVLPVSGEAGFSLKLLLHRPFLMAQMFYNTFLHQLDEIHLTMIGALLGNLDPVLNVPYFLVVFDTAGLAVLALRVPGERIEITGWRRIWIFTVCAVCVAAALLSMLIAWTPRTSTVIEGVQGRYFLPFLPALLMACKNDRIVLTKNGNRSILFMMCCVNLYVLLRLFSVVCLRV